MPAETDPHERTVMAWPTEVRREFFGGHLGGARQAWADVAQAIANFEPVSMVVNPGERPSAEGLLGAGLQAAGAGVELVELPIDDAWMRDSGPIVLRDGVTRRAVQFGFNAWGELVQPFHHDAVVATVVAGHLGLPVVRAPFVLEGGALAVDGAGTVVTTERCLLNPNRGPLPGGSPRTKPGLEALLGEWLGVERVVWLTDGLADDLDTDGHVDNVVAIPRPGLALLQGCEDPADPDHATAADSRARLAAAGFEVVELPVLPRTRCHGREVEVPYLNLYAGNGFVLVPVTGHEADGDALDTIGDLYPGREVVPVDGAMIAYGGGGPHCITQQVPAALDA
ncbi:MAG: agmatine deiminase family protein [Microthrixaceae bacterium]